jgi:predicted nucleotidyltransferase
VGTLALFGSFTRHEERKDSDVNILIEPNRTIDLFELIRIQNYLSAMLAAMLM